MPDPNFPFLGVHFTRMIDGGVECGPNAVLAFAREGYRKTDFNLADMAETLTLSRLPQDGGEVLEDRPGRDVAVGEQGGVRQGACSGSSPRSAPSTWRPSPAGVRAQAVSPDGSMVDDFLIQETDRVINVSNAPSPAATASLNIGKTIVERLVPRLA